jgi:hypothetical protein
VINWLSATSWVIVGGFALLVLASLVILLIFWPRSRRWSVANQLHRLSSRNEADQRRETRHHLDDALRVLNAARRECLSGARRDDTAQLDLLIHQIQTVRDRVVSDYRPSPANAPELGHDFYLDRLLASEIVAQHCGALAALVGDGLQLPTAQLNEARAAVREVDDRGLALP